MLKRFLTVAVLAFSADAFEAADQAAAQTPPPDSAFSERVDPDPKAVGVQQKWAATAQALADEPLFGLLGLNNLQYQAGNEFTQTARLQLPGVTLNLAGTLRVNPDAKSGDPLASLLAVTTGPDSGRDVSFGGLHALSAKLDVVVINQSGSPRLYARILPSFTNAGSPAPFLMLTPRAGGLDYTLLGKSLNLNALVPSAADLPFLKALKVTSVKPLANGFAVNGTVSGKPVAISAADGSKSFAVTGDGLKVSDFVPEAAKIPALNAFALDRVAYSTAALSIAGKIAGKAVSVTRSAGASAVVVTGAGLKISDFIPDAASLPALSAFSFDRFSYDNGSISVAGAINGRAVSAAQASPGKPYSLTGAGLSLAAFVPATAAVPLLKQFALDSVTRDGAALAVAGRIGGSAVSVTVDPATKLYSVTGSALKAADFIPAAAGVPFLKAFAFNRLAQTASGSSVAGTVNGKAVSLTQDAAGKSMAIAGDSLALTDFVPAAASVPLLSKFAFTGYSKAGTVTTVSGTIDGKAVSVTAADGKDGFSATGADLELADFVPGSGDLPLLGRFAFDSAALSGGVLTVSGKVGTVAVAVAFNQTDKSFSVTGAGLKLSDFVPAAASVPLLSQFSLTSVTRSGASVSATGSLGGKSAALTTDVSAKSFTISGAGLSLAGLVPTAATVPFLKQFALESAARDAAGVLTLSGKIGSSAVSVTLDPATKLYTVTGADLKAADFFPAAAGVPFLKAFAFDKLSQTAGGLAVSGKVNGKAVTLSQDAAGKSLAISGDNLGLADFVPQAATVPLLSKFTFTGYSKAGLVTTVSGTINGKAVSVTAADGKDGFSATGADLKLADFVPGSGDLPLLGRFAFDSAALSGGVLTVSGKIGAVAVAVAFNQTDKSFSVTGAGLKLSDFVPAAASVPLLNQFALKSVTRSGTTVSAAGSLSGKDASLTTDLAAKSFTISGAGLSLAGFIPDAAKIPVLGKFAFVSLSYAPGAVTVAGTINGKAVSVSQNTGEKTFTATGADLKLADFVPAVSGVPFLGAFAFDAFSYSTAALSVSGKIAGKAVSVRRGLSDASGFSAAGDGLTLGDIVPETAGLKAFDKLSLSLVSVNAQQFEVDGAVNGKAVKFVKTRGPQSKVTVTAGGLVLSDLFDAANGVPVLDSVAVDKLVLDGVSLEVEAQLNGVTVDVVGHAKTGPGDGYAAVFFKTLDAATFVPAAQGHAVNDIALKNALFIVQPAGAPAKTVTAKDLPGSLPGLVGWGQSDSLKLSPGVNFAATLDVAASGQVASALKTAGVDLTAVPLKGTLSAAAFKAMGGKVKGAASALSAADKQSLLAGLNLSAPLPLPKLPAIAGLVTVSGPMTLSLGGAAQSADNPWSKVPAGLSSYKPSGDLDLSLQFAVDLPGVGVGRKLKALLSLDKSAQSSGLTLLAVYDGTWDKPFGIPGLTLTGGGFKFALEKAAAPGGTATEDLAFFASADLGSKKGVAISADLKRANGKVALQYFELDGPFGLGDFPWGKGLPYAEKFQLDTIKISGEGIEAKTTLSGKKVDAFLFNAGPAGGAPSWTFAIDQKNFKIVELLPVAKAIPPLAAMTIPNAALVITQNGVTLSRGHESGVADDLLDDIFGKAAATARIPAGIGLLAGFDPKAMGLVGQGLSKIGVHDDAIVMGEIGGVFQGAPSLRLSFAMDAPGAAHGLPGKVMSYKAGVEPSFFLLWGGEDLEVGLKIPLLVKAGKDLLELSSSIELELSLEGVGIKIVGGMDGTWHNPFGVKGISLADLKMDAMINDAGEVQLGFAGDEQFGKCDAQGKGPDCVNVNLAVSMKILLEALALPDGVAFAGSVNELGIPAILDIAETLLKVPGQLSKLPIPFFSVKNAKLAFATPGATDPDLGLVSEGFAFGGTFFFMNKQLGSISGAGGPTTGVTFKGKIADIDLEVMKFKNNDVDIAVNLDPKFIINSDVDLLGADQRVKLDIEPPHFEFDLVEKFGSFGDAVLTIRLDGFDLAKGTFDKTADISVVGEFKSTLVPWLEGEIKKGIEELRASAKAKLDADDQSLKDAQSKVDGINGQIAAIKAEDDKAKARAEASLDSIISRVNSLQGSYDHQINEAHHCGSRWTHWACSPGWYIAAGATWTSLQAAKGVLEAAKAAVAAAFDLDPRLTALYAERDIATAGLSIARAVVEATEAVEDFVLKELESVLETALKDLPFDVEQAILLGDLKDMIAKNDPLVLDIKFKMFGQDMREYFALKIPDSPANVEFDAVSFALLPALAMDKMTEAALAKVAPEVKTWVHAHIASKLAEAEAAVRQQVQAEEAKFKDVLASYENGSAKYKKAFADQGAIHAQLVAQTQVSDLMPASLQYTNTYLAVGHSTLCLGVSKDGVKVIQEDCKDVAAERWSTAKLDDGYVQLKSKGLCLKARDGAAADEYEPLILSQCDKNDKHEQWKVVTTDGFYDKIVNRYAQKCLHFNDENANPATAFAVWTDCFGADSQNFRDIADAERPTWHPVNAELKASNGFCLSVTDAAGTPFTPKPGDVTEKLFARDCDDKNERFNYIELVNGDVKLVHGDTGTCLYPQKGTNHMAIRPCDTGKDMLWRVNAQGGKGFQLYNAYANLCMMIPAPPKGRTQVEAVLAACNTVPADGLLLDFVK